MCDLIYKYNFHYSSAFAEKGRSTLWRQLISAEHSWYKNYPAAKSLIEKRTIKMEQILYLIFATITGRENCVNKNQNWYLKWNFNNFNQQIIFEIIYNWLTSKIKKPDIHLLLYIYCIQLQRKDYIENTQLTERSVHLSFVKVYE